MGDQKSLDILLNGIKEHLINVDLEETTVKEICRSCSISSRTFYNYFYDKYDAAAAVYKQHMVEFLAADISEWYEEKANFQIFESSYFRNCIKTVDGNLFIQTFVKIEYEKLLLHVPNAILADKAKKSTIETAILFFIHGQLGITRSANVFNEVPIDAHMFNTNFNNNWEIISGWMPGILKDSLEEKIQRPLSPQLLELFKRKE